MQFESIKVLEQMRELYEMPRTRERFDRYLFMLQGASKNELILPIAGFNPMGKELALAKLNQLIALNAEHILDEVVAKFNQNLTNRQADRMLRVAINLVDDVEGSWSHYCDTDYKSKFKIESLLKRGFCTPIFWTSEDFTKGSIARRIEEYMTRTLFWLSRERPENLEEMLEQEIEVQSSNHELESNLTEAAATILQKFVKEHGSSEDYPLIINFFYGDEGSSTLNYRKHGIIKNGGFEYAKYVARQRQKDGAFNI